MDEKNIGPNTTPELYFVRDGPHPVLCQRWPTPCTLSEMAHTLVVKQCILYSEVRASFPGISNLQGGADAGWAEFQTVQRCPTFFQWDVTGIWRRVAGGWFCVCQRLAGRWAGVCRRVVCRTLVASLVRSLTLGVFGTRPWLALLACGGAYWHLALEPSAMISRDPHYCGHPHCRGHPPAWVGIQNATSAHGVSH